MRMIEYIKEGDEITTATGFLLIGKNRAGLIDCVEFEVYEDGGEHEIGERRLVVAEIAALMKEADGKSHSVRYKKEDSE